MEVSGKKLKLQAGVSDHLLVADLLGNDVPESAELLGIDEAGEKGYLVEGVGRMLKHVMRLVVWNRRWRG